MSGQPVPSVGQAAESPARGATKVAGTAQEDPDSEATLLVTGSGATLLVSDSEATLLVTGGGAAIPGADSEATLLVPPPPADALAQPGTDGPGAGPPAGTGLARTGLRWAKTRAWLTGAAVIVAILAVAGGAFVLFRHPAASNHGFRVASADIPLVTRDSAAAWVAGQVASTDVVACDPVMCRALQAHGITSRKLRVLWPGSDNLAGCSVVIGTPAVQGQLGAHLGDDYAPGVIARFGSGDREIAVRTVAPHGAAAYRADLGKDLAVRKQAGAVLAAQAGAELSGAEQKELAAGQVDARVMVVIADIEGKHPVRVSAFGDAGPGVPMTMAPLRSADLAVTSGASKRAVLAELSREAAQDPGYRAAHVATVHLPHGQTALQIQFAAPSPLGLLGY